MSNRYDLLDTELDAVKSGMTNHEAFYAVMVAAMMSDGELDKRETEALLALAHRTAALFDFYDKEPAKFKAMTDAVDRKFQDAGGAILKGDALIRRASEVAVEAAGVIAKDKEMAYSAYAHAVDIVFADSVVRPPEKRFLKLLAEKLDIPPNDALEVLKVLNKKNKF